MSEPLPDNPSRPRIGRCLLHAVSAAAGVAALAGMLAFAFTRPSANIEVSPAARLVGYTFATMGLTWLGAIFLLGRFDWAGVFRWAGAVDAAGVALLLFASLGGAVGWREGLKLYAILASFAVLQLALAWLVWRVSRSAGASSLAAVALAVVAMTTLLWGHLPDRLTRAESPGDRAIISVIRYGNPLLAANDALSPRICYDWSRNGGWMYRRYSIIGEARMVGMPDWPKACGAYLLAAGLLTGAGLLAGRKTPAARRQCRGRDRQAEQAV